MGDVSLAVQRAENKTDQMRAKAGAIDELVATGVLDDITGPQDDIERELAQISSSASIEAELAALKGISPPAGAETRSLPAGQPSVDDELSTLRGQRPSQTE
jgi:phage shock protein A